MSISVKFHPFLYPITSSGPSFFPAPIKFLREKVDGFLNLSAYRIETLPSGISHLRECPQSLRLKAAKVTILAITAYFNPLLALGVLGLSCLSRIAYAAQGLRLEPVPPPPVTPAPSVPVPPSASRYRSERERLQNYRTGGELHALMRITARERHLYDNTDDPISLDPLPAEGNLFVMGRTAFYPDSMAGLFIYSADDRTLNGIRVWNTEEDYLAFISWLLPDVQNPELRAALQMRVEGFPLAKEFVLAFNRDYAPVDFGFLLRSIQELMSHSTGLGASMFSEGQAAGVVYYTCLRSAILENLRSVLLPSYAYDPGDDRCIRSASRVLERHIERLVSLGFIPNADSRRLMPEGEIPELLERAFPSSAAALGPDPREALYEGSVLEVKTRFIFELGWFGSFDLTLRYVDLASDDLYIALATALVQRENPRPLADNENAIQERARILRAQEGSLTLEQKVEKMKAFCLNEYRLFRTLLIELFGPQPFNVRDYFMGGIPQLQERIYAYVEGLSSEQKLQLFERLKRAPGFLASVLDQPVLTHQIGKGNGYFSYDRSQPHQEIYPELVQRENHYLLLLSLN